MNILSFIIKAQRRNQICALHILEKLVLRLKSLCYELNLKEKLLTLLTKKYSHTPIWNLPLGPVFTNLMNKTFLKGSGIPWDLPRDGNWNSALYTPSPSFWMTQVWVLQYFTLYWISNWETTLIRQDGCQGFSIFFQVFSLA